MAAESGETEQYLALIAGCRAAGEILDLLDLLDLLELEALGTRRVRPAS